MLNGLNESVPALAAGFESAFREPLFGEEIQEESKVSVAQGKKRAPVKKWTAEEDDILRSGIMSYLSRGLKPDYEEIVKSLKTRSVKQAKERWKNSLNPEIKKGGALHFGRYAYRPLSFLCVFSFLLFLLFRVLRCLTEHFALRTNIGCGRL